MRPPARPRPPTLPEESFESRRPPAPNPARPTASTKQSPNTAPDSSSAVGERTPAAPRPSSRRTSPVPPVPPVPPPPTAVSTRSAAATATASSSTAPSAAPASSVSSGLAARLAERARATRRRRWIRYGSIGAGLLLVMGVAWLAFLSPVFRLDMERIEMTGQGTVIAPGAVEKVVAAEAGTPLTIMDTVGLRNRILDIAGVRDVVVTRDWPKGMKIVLTASEPVAAVPDGTGFTLRDDLADVVGRADAVPDGLPVIEVPQGDQMARTLEAAIFMLNAVPADLHKEIRSVSATTPDAVSMELRGGATVLWGSQADADLKVRVFEVLRTAKSTKDSKVFDVSAPNAPITR